MGFHLPPDVVQLIVDAVDSRATLAAMACSARALSEPALDKLWYRLDDLCKLARCMPENWWHESLVSWSNFTISKTYILALQASSPDDWILGPNPRLLTYSRRVRELCIEEPSYVSAGVLGIRGVTILEDSIVGAWLRHFEGTPLFPNVRRLRLADHWLQNPLYTQLIQTCRVAPLRSITLVAHTAGTVPPPALDLFANLKEDYPRVEEIAYDVDHFSADPTNDWSALASRPVVFSDVLSTAVTQMINFRHVSTFAVLPLQVLSHLSALPHLEYLRCRLPEEISADERPRGFDALQHLSVHADDISTLSAFLDGVSSHELHTLSCAIGTAPSQDDATSLLHQISTHPSHPSVRRLALKLARGAAGVWSVPSADVSDALSPLRGMQQLRVLALPLLAVAPLDEVDVMACYDAFPAVHFLDLGSVPVLSTPSIRLFLARAPDERPMRFSLRMDANTLYSLPKIPIRAGMECVYIDRMPQVPDEELASVLLGYFPDLKRVSQLGSNYDDYLRLKSLHKVVGSLRTHGHAINAHSCRMSWYDMLRQWVDRTSPWDGIVVPRPGPLKLVKGYSSSVLNAVRSLAAY